MGGVVLYLLVFLHNQSEKEYDFFINQLYFVTNK